MRNDFIQEDWPVQRKSRLKLHVECWWLEKCRKGIKRRSKVLKASEFLLRKAPKGPFGLIIDDR